MSEYTPSTEDVREGWREEAERHTITAFRCERCGKWSHAKRKPKHHTRFIRDEPEESDTVLEQMPPSFSYEGPNDDGGYMIACGPFRAYACKPLGEDS